MNSKIVFDEIIFKGLTSQIGSVAAVLDLIHISGASVTDLSAPQGVGAVLSSLGPVSGLHVRDEVVERGDAACAEVIGHVDGHSLGSGALEGAKDALSSRFVPGVVHVKQVIADRLADSGTAHNLIIVGAGLSHLTPGVAVAQIVAVADGRDAHGVVVHLGSEALALLNQLVGSLARAVQVHEVVLVEGRLLHDQRGLLQIDEEEELLLGGLAWEHGEGSHGEQ